MLISEIYESRQGEGLLTGTDSIFVRTSGCNLRCHFCDTPYTSWDPTGQPLSVDEIVQRVSGFDSKHVVITGGEPMLPREIVPLTDALHKHGYHLTIETAGTIDRAVHCDLISLSPKLTNSNPTAERAGEWAERHDQRRLNVPVLDQLLSRYPYQLKFVVAAETDLDEIEGLLSKLTSIERGRVLLMPEGVDDRVLAQRKKWLEPLALTRGFQFCPRMHIEWYGNRRGT